MTCRSDSCVPQNTNLSSQVYETLLKNGAGGALDVAFSIISWSFNALLTGCWPMADWNGRKHTECLIVSFFCVPIITITSLFSRKAHSPKQNSNIIAMGFGCTPKQTVSAFLFSA